MKLIYYRLVLKSGGYIAYIRKPTYSCKLVAIASFI